MGDRRRQVADQRRRGAALGDRALGRVVGGVEVEVGQVADQPVGPAGGRQAGLLAGHELERAVRAEVQHRVRRRSPRAASGRRRRRRASARSPSRTAAASGRLRSRRRAGCRRRRCRTARRARRSSAPSLCCGRAPDPTAPRSRAASARGGHGRRPGCAHGRWHARRSARALPSMIRVAQRRRRWPGTSTA